MSEEPKAQGVSWRFGAGPVTIAELSAGLIWPTMLRAPALALQPPRIALGVLIVAVIGSSAAGFDGVLGALGSSPLAVPMIADLLNGLARAGASLLALDPASSANEAVRAVLLQPGAVLADRPIAGAIWLAWAIGVWSILGGALCRLVAVDVAGDLNMTSRQGLAFAVRRWGAFVGAALLPLALAGVLAAIIKIVGWLLLSLPVIDVIGAVAYGALLVLGLAVVLCLTGYTLGQGLLAPAAAVEGADAVDAVQRAYAYVIGRPARLVLYGGLGMVQGVVVLAIVAWVLDRAVGVTGRLAGSWLSDERAGRLWAGAEGGGTDAAPLSARLIDLWAHVAEMLVFGAGVSLFFSTCTVLYLLLRRVNDEQDIREIWMPGFISGALAGTRPPTASRASPVSPASPASESPEQP